MDTVTRLEQIDSAIREQQARIDAAYWSFIHCAQGKPPVLVVPDAYTIRNQLRKERRELRHTLKITLKKHCNP